MLRKPGRPFVSCLLCSRFPSAVPRRIRAIVIYSSERAAMRGNPHVSEERLERILPLLTDRNTSLAVVTVKTVVRVQTSLLHAIPDPVFSKPLHASHSQSLRAARGRNGHGR